MEGFSEWLAGTPASQLIQNVGWIIPTSQSIHILAVAVILASAGAIILRIFGKASALGTIAETSKRFERWIWVALVFVALTGVAQLVAEPGRSLTNTTFWLKMAMLSVSIVLMAVFQRSVAHGAPHWDEGAGQRQSIKLIALFAFALWIAIAIAGRWIAYTHIE
jgi:uncharacterized membrane protein